MTALRSGELAAAGGVGRETLRYYERRGLLPAPRRSLGGQREYPLEAVRRLRAIRAAQRLGFTLAEIDQVLSSSTRRAGTWQAQASRKIGQIDAEIEHLRAVRETLVAALEAGCTDLLSCVGSPCCPAGVDGGQAC